MTKDSAIGGKWKEQTVFRLYTTTAADLDVSYADTDTPAKTFAGRVPTKIKSGIIKRVHFRLTPTNAVTYTLRLWADALADDNSSRLRKLFDSTPLRAKDVEYDLEVEIPFILTTAGTMYFGNEWSAAAGGTTGFIEVSGVKVS